VRLISKSLYEVGEGCAEGIKLKKAPRWSLKYFYNLLKLVLD
jgi:hypothetical protein